MYTLKGMTPECYGFLKPVAHQFQNEVLASPTVAITDLHMVCKHVRFELVNIIFRYGVTTFKIGCHIWNLAVCSVYPCEAGCLRGKGS